MIEVRTARASDDLSFWKGLSQNKLNLDQVLIAEENGAVVGALIYWDAGHDVVFVGDLTNLDGRRATALKLLKALTTRVDKKHLFFHTRKADFAGFAKKLGAYRISSTELYSIPTENVRNGLQSLPRAARRLPA